MKKILLSLPLLLIISFPVFAQVLLEQDIPKGAVAGKLVINGNARELQQRLKNVIVILYQDIDKTGKWVEIEKQLTKANGEFGFKLDLNSKYLIEVARGGYTTKKVSFDTDVYQLTNTPEPFDFIVDLVPDRDGLGYLKPVANVFYQVRKKAFDYELDYTKEEQEEEAKLERERIEKLEFQRKAAEEKALRELEAQKLINNESAIGQQSIEEAIKIGNGDKTATIEALKKTFAKADTLAEKKAEVIYSEYEKQKLSSANSKVDYASLFDAGKKYEEQVVKAKEEEIKKVQEEIRKAKEEIAQKEKEAQEKQKQAAALELQPKLQEANRVEEEKRIKKEAEQKQKIEQAITIGAGDKDATIKELSNIYLKDDPYKEQKATAIYEAYEKQKLSGSTLSNIDYASLFDAANFAEITAQEAAEKKQVEEQKARVDEYIKKVNQKTLKEEAEAIAKIEEAVKNSAGDKEKLIQAFKQTFAKDDQFAEQKATAMYEQYEADRKMRELQGKNYSAVDYASIFNAGKQAELTAVDEERKKKEDAIAKSEVALYMAMEEKRKQRQEESKKAEVNVEKTREEKLQQAKTEDEKKIQNAIISGNGDRESTINALKNALPSNTPYRDQKAVAMYEQYERDKKAAELSGETNIIIDYKSLFAAANLVEVQELQKSFEEKKNSELAAQEKRRIENEQKSKEILSSKSDVTEKLLADAGKEKEDAIARAEQEKRVKEELARAAEEKRLKDEAEAKAKAEEDRKAKEEAARLAEEKRLKEEAEAKAKAEEDRKAKEEAARLAEEKRLKEAAEAKAKAEAKAEEERKAKEEAARLAEEKRLKEEAEAKAKADAEKQKQAAEAARLAEEKRLKEEAEAKAMAEAKKKAEEEAARLAEEKRLKAEADAKAFAEAKKKAEEEAARLAEEKRLKDEAEAKAIAEAKKKAEEEKARIAEEKRIKDEAEAKAREEAARLAEEKRIKDIADAKERADAEKKAREDAARLAEEKRLRDEAEAKARAEAEVKRIEQEKIKEAEYKKAQEEAKRLSEEERQKRFEAAQERAKNLKLDEKERRAQFLSDIALIYPEGVTEENIDGKDFKLQRFIINNSGTVTVYDKKTWNWGGIFCFKNTDIAITEALFDLEVKKNKTQ